MLPREKAQRLVDLAEKAFPEPPLGKAEREMLRAAALGAGADLRAGNDAEDDPAGAKKWSADRAVRAELLRWLCTEHEASGLVDPRGVQVRGVRIDGRPDLSCADMPFRLGFFGSAFPAGLDLMDARLPGLLLSGSHTGPIVADRVTVTGGVFLRDKFHATGEVRLLGASVGGNLVCSGGTFENPNANALNADGIQVKGDVFLNEGFRASGEVRLVGASVGGDLVCSGGTFENPDGDALSADGIQVKGGVFLRRGFRATGMVRLVGASVGGDLDCGGGTFENPGGWALNADGARIDCGLIMRGKFGCDSGVNLAYARVRVLADAPASWPERGRLVLDGLTYDALHGRTDATARLKWLERQYPAEHIRPQPYDQLAAVLRRMGHEGEARKVLMGKHEHQRKYGTMGKCARAWNWLMGKTIGHGYKPQRAFWLAPIFLLFGCVLFASVEMHQVDENSAPFSAIGYSFDAFFLIVDLHQYDAWEPVCSWARAYVWFHAFCGVVLTAALVAGLTGLVRRE